MYSDVEYNYILSYIITFFAQKTAYLSIFSVLTVHYHVFCSKSAERTRYRFGHLQIESGLRFFVARLLRMTKRAAHQNDTRNYLRLITRAWVNCLCPSGEP